VIAAVRERAENTLLDSGIRVSAAKLLERFMFDAEAQKSTLGDLSGGERRRLELLLTLMEAPNLLFLDEPTNDLDLDTLEVLEEYLDAWKGALVIASHDRYFLDRVCDDIYSIESDGSLRHHPGGWPAYWADRQMSAPAREGTPEPEKAGRRNRPPAAGTKPTWRQRKDLGDLAALIPRLEREQTDLNARLDTVGDDYVAATDLAQRLGEIAAELDVAETAWLELTEIVESYDDA
jgi:ATP-binding cassette subfamily F protein uup